VITLLVLVILPLLSVFVLSSVPEEAYSTLLSSSEKQVTPKTEVTVLSLNDPIQRGNRQTLSVSVFESQSKQGIAGITINGVVTYASGLPIYEFNGKTNEAGHFSYSWTIDEDAEPGTFIAAVSATSEQYSIRIVESTTFEVV
jgi:hypothetical protein